MRHLCYFQVVSKGRLGPGQMIACDLVKGGFEDNWTIKEQVAAKRPYGEWLKTHAKVCRVLIRVVVRSAVWGLGRVDVTRATLVLFLFFFAVVCCSNFVGSFSQQDLVLSGQKL